MKENVLKKVLIDSHSKLLVTSRGHVIEWKIVTDGQVEVESHMLYGDVNIALRDGLMFATTGYIPINIDVSDAPPALVNSHPGLVFNSRLGAK